MYGSKGKEILADRKLSESSKSLRKKYPKGSLSPQTRALDKMKNKKKGGGKPSLKSEN